jgi:anhydro-N-acetylmuramic acid kinase
VRDAILAVSNAHCHTADISRLNFLLPELYAKTLRDLCRKHRIDTGSVDLIGCHGQTIFHEDVPAPVAGRRVASTLQIGDGSVLAELTGITVVSDFRPRDMAAGGKGAPLVPFLDYALFRHRSRGRVALNLGGIANITAIPPRCSPRDVIAFDTGPANMVMDQLIGHATGGKQTYDRNGRMASQGRILPDLANRLLDDAYFSMKPPKSAGREQFGAAYVSNLLATGLPVADLVATSAYVTAAAVRLAVDRFVRTRQNVDDLIVGGGGVHNRALMSLLVEMFPATRVVTTAGFGIDPDAKEAVAFALLAYQTHRARPSNIPSATGARRAVILGKISLA